MTTQVRRLLVTALRSIENEIGQEEAADMAGVSSRPKSRQGKKTIVGHFDPAVAWQLKKLALDQQKTVQAMLEESLNDLFEKHHLPRF